MLAFVTINVDGEYREWYFDSIEELKREYHKEDYDLAGNDDPVTEMKFHGVPMHVDTFDDIIELFGIEDDFDITIQALEELQQYKANESTNQLPCKVGDTVFVLMNGNTKIVECTVLWIELHKNGVVVFALDGGIGDVVIAHLGKKWFLTKEEAEQALKQMEERENDLY